MITKDFVFLYFFVFGKQLKGVYSPLSTARILTNALVPSLTSILYGNVAVLFVAIVFQFSTRVSLYVKPAPTYTCFKPDCLSL